MIVIVRRKFDMPIEGEKQVVFHRSVAILLYHQLFQRKQLMVNSWDRNYLPQHHK